MSRIVSLVFAFFVFLVIIGLGTDLSVLLEARSALVATVLPLVFLLAIFGLGEVLAAIKHLSAPADAGITACQFRQSALVFNVYGTLSLVCGVLSSLISLVYILQTLASSAGFSLSISISLISLLYSVMIILFVCYPAQRILENAAAQSELFEEDFA